MSWVGVCELADVLPDTGVCALVNGRQIAVFRCDESVFAIDNYDPASAANVLSRGLLGDVKGERVVASPIYKHHFSLTTGRCLEDSSKSVNVYPARVLDGRLWVNATPQQQALRTRRRLVVIGNGMAGMRTVEELLQLAPDLYDITVFGAEPHVNYNRILLSPVLGGEKRLEEIILHTPAWYAEHGVKLHSGDAAVEIDRRRRVVRSQNGVEAPYDRLLVATGSKPIVLPVPGAQLRGVMTFRDVADVDAMLEAARCFRKAVVIGGGLLGLEAANALIRRGMDVTVVHLFATLMERQLDESAAALLKVSLEARGLKFHMPAKTAAILGAQRVTGVRFDDGVELEADLVVMAAGVRPNTELGSRAGLRSERGILVDDTMQTFDPCIYAVGECVQHRNNTFGLVAPLWEQARVCALHLAEVGIGRYRGSFTATQLKVTGIELYSAGDFAGSDGTEALVLRDPRRGVYKRLVIRDNKLRGAVLYGDVRDGAWYSELISAGRDITTLRYQLLFGPAMAASAEAEEARA
ncbi:MAG: assimilatory nitrite reductase large subunit [Gammaproteobacteria bacterium]|nr:assimilatory nitrite reductase large subunit [Gammaproteobacteria bacterium]